METCVNLDIDNPLGFMPSKQAITISSTSSSSSGGATLQIIDDDFEEVTQPILQEKNALGSNQKDSMYEGMKFESEEDAYTKYNEFARKVGFSVRKGKAYKRSDGTTRCRNFVCYKEGFRENDSRCKNVWRKRRETRTGCKARLMVKEKDCEWFASDIVFEHNHPLSTPKKTFMLRSHKNMKNAHEAEIDSLNIVGIQPMDGYDYMVQQAGGHANLGITLVDYKNYLRKKRLEVLGVGDGSAVLNYFMLKKAENPSFFYEIMVDDENRLTNFFWADAKSIIDYHHFGDVVVFDTTYRTNKYGRPFAPFVGVNHHNQTVIFGGALLIDERTESFEWLFHTWLRAMSGKKPKTILTDQCAAMAKAISIVLPETQHRLCLWHIFQNAAKHLSHVYKIEGFSKKFKRVIYNCETEEEFLIRWEKLLKKFDLVNNTWLAGLYELRQKWVLVYSRDIFCADMSTTQRGESINAFLKRFVKRKYSLTEFVNRYERAIQRRRHTELVSDFEEIKATPKLFAPALMLTQASEKYAYVIFTKFENEYKEHLMCKLESCHIDEEGVHGYIVTQEERRSRIVKFKSSNCDVVCSCKKFEFSGIICCHIVKVLYYWNIHEIPTQYVLRRWTKDAKREIVRDESGNPIQAICNADISFRYNDLCRMAVNLALMGAVNDHVHMVAKSVFEDGFKKVEAATKANQQAPHIGVSSKDTTHVGVAEENLIVAEGCDIGRPSAARQKSCLETNKKKKKAKKRVDKDDNIETNTQIKKQKKGKPKKKVTEGESADRQPAAPRSPERVLSPIEPYIPHLHAQESTLPYVEVCEVSNWNTSHGSFSQLWQQGSCQIGIPHLSPRKRLSFDLETEGFLDNFLSLEQGRKEYTMHG